MDLMAGVMQRVDRSKKAAFVDAMHTEQFLVCMTYKLIWTKVLPEVDTTVAKLTWHAALGKLEKAGVCTERAPRAFARMKAVVSVLVVMTAIEKVFHSPGGEYYAMDFDPGQMHSLGPFLVATEEQAWYVLTLMSSCWMNEAEPDGVRQLASIMAKLPRRGSALWADPKYAPALVDQVVQYRVKREDSDSVCEKYDFNRLTIKGTLDAIAERLSKAPGERVISKENARSMLMSMKGRTITVCRRIKPGEDGDDPAQVPLTLPILEADGDSGSKWSLSTAWALDVATMYGEAKMKEVIGETFHNFTLARKVITGFTHKDFVSGGQRRVYPHVYQIIEAKPRLRTWFKVTNKPHQVPAFFVADCTLDKWAFDQHCEDNAYDAPDEWGPDAVDARFKQQWADVDGGVNYPKDALVQAIEEDKQLDAAPGYANAAAIDGAVRLTGVKRRKLA